MPSGIIGAVGSIAGGLIGSSGAQSAADTQAAAADRASQVQWDMYNQTRQDQMPFLNTGVLANKQLAYLLGLKQDYSGAPVQTAQPVATPNNPDFTFQRGVATPGMQPDTYDQFMGKFQNRSGGAPFSYSDYLSGLGFEMDWVNGGAKPIGGYQTQTAAPAPPVSAPTSTGDPYGGVNTDMGGFGSLSKSFGTSDFQADPGYAFRMSEGQKAIERSAAAKGGLMSGAALKAITRFGQDTASNEYQNAYNRYNTNQTNLYNRLAGISGTGQTSANTLANVGQSTANQVSDIGLQGANARAAGQVGSANAWSTGLSSIGSSLGGMFNNTGQNGLPWQSFGNVNPSGGYYY